MLIKDKEFKEEAVEQLMDLLSLELGAREKFLAERELKNLNPAATGGQNAAHFINFYCADCHDLAIIHDLSLEGNTGTAHVDHVLIDRFLDIYLFESANYSYNLKVTATGEFLIFDGRRYQPVDSPLEENENRIQVLKEVLEENKIIPRRLGIGIRPKIKAYVLVSPKSNVLRPPESVYDTRSIITADYLINTLLKQTGRMARTFKKAIGMQRAVTADVLYRAAEKLASLNKPSLIDYGRMLGQQEPNGLMAIGASRQDGAAYGDYAI